MSRIFLSALLLATFGCAAEDEDDNTDPEGAKALLATVQADDYRSWSRAPGYEVRVPSKGPHSIDVDIYVNDVVVAALAGASLDEWPEGSLVAKDGFKGEKLEIVALMEKRSDGWYWAELSGSGAPKFSGHPSICTDCHRSGDDFMRSFDLP